MKPTPPPPPTKNRIGFYFEKETTSSTASATTTANAIPESVETEKKLTLNQKALTTTINTSSPIGNREEFLIARETEMIRNIFISFNLPFQSFFTLDVKNDKNFVQFLTAFCYKWGAFQNLQEQYYRAQLRNNRKSELESKLESIDEVLTKTKSSVWKVCDLSSQIKEHSGSTFQIIQSYLKKSEAITNLLASTGGLKDLISQSELLNAIRRRIKQQNDNFNNHFVRNPDELLNFFCENNTDVTCQMSTTH